MNSMNWITAIENWRNLPQAEQRRRRRANLPYKVARSMAFEGEPVDQVMLEAELVRLTQQPTTSTALPPA